MLSKTSILTEIFFYSKVFVKSIFLLNRSLFFFLQILLTASVFCVQEWYIRRINQSNYLFTFIHPYSTVNKEQQRSPFWIYVDGTTVVDIKITFFPHLSFFSRVLLWSVFPFFVWLYSSFPCVSFNYFTLYFVHMFFVHSNRHASKCFFFQNIYLLP